jgi:hypothetical protein
MQKNSPLRDLDALILFYLFVLFVLFALLVETPYLITHGIFIFSEESLELTILTVLSLLGATMYRVYRREIDRKTKDYNEIAQHVGVVNRQIESMRSMAQKIQKLPQTKGDLKQLLTTMCERALEITPYDWVLIRIIDEKTTHTLSEHAESRGRALLMQYEIGNKDLLDHVPLEGYTVLASNHLNALVRTCAIMPTEALSDEQQTMLQAIVNEVTLLYLVYTSRHYKGSD